MDSSRGLHRGTLLTWLGSLAPAAPVAFLVATNAVDTLFMDDWDLVGMTLVRARSGGLGIEQLLAQHNESRPLVPRLLFLAVGTAARGDTRWLLAVNLAIACLVSYSLFCLIRATVTAKPSHLLGLGFLANLLLFTPKQAETWLWCSYMGLEPIVCLTATLAMLHSGRSSAARVATGAVLCAAATFSYANGLSAWVLAAPVVATTADRRWLGPWALGFLLSAAVYFRGYVQPLGLPLSGLEPVRLAHYLLTFLGAPLGVNRVAVATTIGALLLLAFTLVCVYWLTHVGEEGLRSRLAPWLSIGGYAVLSGIATAMGRSSFGVQHALANRYVPFSLYLPVALVGAVPIVWQHLRAHRVPGPQGLRTAGALLTSALAGGLVLHSASAAIGVGELIREGRMLRYGRTCLLFSLVRLDERCLGDWVYPSAPAVVQMARDLERLGYLRPGLITSPRLQDLSEPGTTPVSPGVFESLSTKRARFVAEGWAGLPAGEGPADAVVLAGRQASGDWTPIGFAPVVAPRPDVAMKRGPTSRDSAWRGELVRREFRNRPVEVSAWAFDAERRLALPLQNTFTAEVETAPRR